MIRILRVRHGQATTCTLLAVAVLLSLTGLACSKEDGASAAAPTAHAGAPVETDAAAVTALTAAAAAAAANDIAASEDTSASEDTAPVPAAPAVVDLKAEADLRQRAPDGVGAPPKDATRKNGITCKVLKEGAGDLNPKADDTVFMHYSTWTLDGQLKGTTWRTRQPKQMTVAKAVEGWQRALAAMLPGERRICWIPAKLAHPRSRGNARKLGDRVVDLELVKHFAAPTAPADVRRAPKDAVKTKSGLAWKSLEPGKGGDHPTVASMVTVHYAGWTTNGHCFDFTGPGETASFPLSGVIAGWTEGLQLLVPGQKARFWLPSKLAYDGKPGKPAGMLVFDVELVEFKG